PDDAGPAPRLARPLRRSPGDAAGRGRAPHLPHLGLHGPGRGVRRWLRLPRGDHGAARQRRLGRRRRRGCVRSRAPVPPERPRSPVHASETVEITGHLIDTGILSRVLDDVREYGGDWVIDKFDVGHEAADLSSATITVTNDDDEALARLLMRLQTRGVNQVDPGELEVSTCELDGVFPDHFYSTTNLATRVRIAGRWVPVENPEMDCGLVVDMDADPGSTPRVRTLPMSDVKAGMKVVCGASGIRVDAPLLTKAEGSFGFMESDVSSEKP